MMRLQVYEPVTEGSYIKMIDMVSGEGGHMQVRTIGLTNPKFADLQITQIHEVVL
jgi:hypothetical protein